MKRAHRDIQRRPLLRGAAGQREPWRKLAIAARLTAEHASGAIYEAMSVAGRPSAMEQLRILRRDCSRPSWPIEGDASAGKIAEAFLATLDAFAGEHTAAARRVDWACLLREAASQVIALLDEQTGEGASHAARAWVD